MKELVKNKVEREISQDLDRRGPAGVAAQQRRTALRTWLASLYPLSFNEDMLPHLLMAIIPFEQPQLSLLQSHIGSTSIAFLVDAIIAQCHTRPRSLRPPFISKGHFYAVARIAIEEGHKIALGYGLQPDGYNDLIKEAFRIACTTLKINHVPWSMNPDGRHGAPSTRVVHNVWLNLGAKSPRSALGPAPLIAHQHSRQEVTLRSSSAMQLADPQEEWTALDVKLIDFHTMVHKSTLPTEFDLPLPSGSVHDSDAYVEETYNYVRESYDSDNHLHHLALIAAIASAGLLPNIFPPKKIEIPKSSSKYSDCIRNVDWVTRSRGGATHGHIFIKMVTYFIIAMYDKSSPVSLRANKKAWFKKHSK